MHRLARHEQRNDGEDDRAGKSTKDTHLASAETVARVCRVASAKIVGEGRDEKSRHVGAHVPSVGQQSHRSECDASGNLDEHHAGRNGDHDAGAAFRHRSIEREVVRVVKACGVGVVHNQSLPEGA
jgi:hypothetical protein